MVEAIIGLAVFAFCMVVILQHRRASRTYRPLSQRQPQMERDPKPELGMEAIDMTEINRTTARNESLERTSNAFSRGRDKTSAANMAIQPMADNETYARRFYAAFMKNKDKSHD